MKIILFYSFFFLTHVFVFTQLDAEIVEAANFAEVEKAFLATNATTLGVLDMDGVLTYSANPAFQRGNWQANHQFVKCLLSAMLPDQRWLFQNLSLLQGNLQAIDPNAWSVIRRLQEKPGKLIALTNGMTGWFNHVYLQDWRYTQLKRLNLDFSKAFPAEPSFCFNDLATFMGRKPVFYKGILMTNGDYLINNEECNQARVLISFLVKVNWKPTKVIYVEDNKKNLQKMEQAFKCFDPAIEFIGVYFTQAPTVQAISAEDFQSEWNKAASHIAECIN